MTAINSLESLVNLGGKKRDQSLFGGSNLFGTNQDQTAAYSMGGPLFKTGQQQGSGAGPNILGGSSATGDGRFDTGSVLQQGQGIIDQAIENQNARNELAVGSMDQAVDIGTDLMGKVNQQYAFLGPQAGEVAGMSDRLGEAGEAFGDLATSAGQRRQEMIGRTDQLMGYLEGRGDDVLEGLTDYSNMNIAHNTAAMAEQAKRRKAEIMASDLPDAAKQTQLRQLNFQMAQATSQAAGQIAESHNKTMASYASATNQMLSTFAQSGLGAIGRSDQDVSAAEALGARGGYDTAMAQNAVEQWEHAYEMAHANNMSAAQLAAATLTSRNLTGLAGLTSSMTEYISDLAPMILELARLDEEAYG